MIIGRGVAMRKRYVWICLLLVAALFLNGCMRTVDQMYFPPKRSDDYNNLQSAIDSAMSGLEYCAPLSGENQQTVQLADLDGNGVDEYIVFAKGASEKPLQVLIFSQQEDGTVLALEVHDTW